MKISKIVKLSSGVYVLFAGKQRIFVDGNYYYDRDLLKEYTDTDQVLEWLLWITKEDLKKIK